MLRVFGDSGKIGSIGVALCVVGVLMASGCGLITREEERTGKAGIEVQNVSGRIQSVNAESDRFAFIPQDGDRIIFRTNENSAITVGGDNTPLSEIEDGQRGTVSYIVRGEDRNIARTVILRPAGGNSQESTSPEETTDEPAEPVETTVPLEETTGL